MLQEYSMSSLETTTQRGRREAVVRDHVAAENAGDVGATLTTFHRPRYNVLPMGVVSDGEEAVRQLVGGLINAFPDFHFEIGKLHHADDAVIVEGVMTGTH
jgi:ketosteroid isomerase-like protein